MARSPSKLRDLLKHRGVEESTITDRLAIIPGDATNVDTVKKALIVRNRPANLIISGVGGKPSFANPLNPTLDNPTICQDATRAILTAASALDVSSPSDKPVLAVTSTTGLNDHARDVPYLMMPLYLWALRVPHADKRIMEGLILEAMQKPPRKRPIQSYTILRPSVFTDGDVDTLENVKVGGEHNPAIGYTITRKQVGRWIFENLVQAQGRYHEEILSITA